MKQLKSKRTVAGMVGALAVLGGGGLAIAASGDGAGSPTEFLNAVARHLGVTPQELEDATKAAAIDQVNAALEDGRLTEEQANELKERIEAGDRPPFFGPGFGFFGGFHHGLGPGLVDKLSAAAEFLGLEEAELRERLRDGQSLADVAEAENKSVDGLKQAILADAKSDLDAAVNDERLTREQADRIYERLQAAIDRIVTNTFDDRRGHRFFRGPGGAPNEERTAVFW
jgi:Rad3-related DNA helicase